MASRIGELADAARDAAATTISTVTPGNTVYRGAPEAEAFVGLLEDADYVHLDRSRSDAVGHRVVARGQGVQEEHDSLYDRVKFLMTASFDDFNRPQTLRGDETGVAAAAYLDEQLPDDAREKLVITAHGDTLRFDYTARWTEEVEDRLSQMPDVTRNYDGAVTVDGDAGAYLHGLGFDDGLRV